MPSCCCHCPTSCRSLVQQSFHHVPPTQNLQQGGQEGLLEEFLPGDVPHAEGYNMAYTLCLSPEVWGGGQLLQGPQAAPLALFSPSSSLSFFFHLSADAARWLLGWIADRNALG